MDTLLRELEKQLGALSSADRERVIMSCRALITASTELKGKIKFSMGATLKALGAMTIFLQSGRTFEEFMTKAKGRAKETGAHVYSLFSAF